MSDMKMNLGDDQQRGKVLIGKVDACFVLRN